MATQWWGADGFGALLMAAEDTSGTSPDHGAFGTQPVQETVEATAVQVTAAPQNGVVGGAPVAQAAGAHPLRPTTPSWTPEQPPANGGFGLQQEQEPVEAVAVAKPTHKALGAPAHTDSSAKRAIQEASALAAKRHKCASFQAPPRARAV